MFDHKHGGQEKLTFRMKENELKKKKNYYVTNQSKNIGFDIMMCNCEGIFKH